MLSALLLNPVISEEVAGDISVSFITDGLIRCRRHHRHRRSCKKRRHRRCYPPLRDCKGKFLRKADEKRFVELTNRMRNKLGRFVPDQSKMAA